MTKTNKRESLNIDSWKYSKLEPPKIYYFISEDGGMWSDEDIGGILDIKRKRIGNYFESEKEVIKAQKKLMAWKRLKDKGFRFELWDYDGGNYQERIRTGRILFRVKDDEDVDELLDLLFGGEE